jgi:hypothetical protein
MRVVLWPCALVVVAFSACECGGVVDPVGSWDFTWTVEEATGLCAGEVGEVSTGVIDITGEDDALELAGFGDGEAVLTGSFEDNTLQFEGSYADDTGTTTTSTVLDFSSTGDSLTGTEQWSWESEASPGACPSATSSVTATRR